MALIPVLRKNICSYLPQVKDNTKFSHLTDHEMFLPFVDQKSPRFMSHEYHTVYRQNARQNGQSYIKSSFTKTGLQELYRMVKFNFLDLKINENIGVEEFGITDAGLERCKDFFDFVDESNLSLSDVKTSFDEIQLYIQNNKNSHENFRYMNRFLQYFQNDCQYRKVYDLMVQASTKKNGDYCSGGCHGEVVKRRDGYYNGIHFEDVFYNLIGENEFNRIITNFENELKNIPDLKFYSIPFKKGRQIEIKCCDNTENLSTFIFNFEKSIQQLFGCFEKSL